ncbi:MAG: LacI family DNA-binding transcriptional regulator [Lentisphaeria bacterium]|nr:LacI family DNA-binding transcriptional regulator [Lentisphaeria bacterium]
MVTLRDIAEKIGVSTCTVSHAVNGTGHLAPETRERILATVRDLGYRKNYAASTLRSGDSRTIGVVFPSLRLYLYELMAPMEKIFRQHGYSLIYTFFERGKDYLANFAAAAEHLLQMNVGAIITPTFEYVPDTSVPIILWGNDIPGFDCVFFDKVQFGHEIVNRLWKMGHRRIGVAGLLTEVRYTAMRETLKQHGSDFSFEFSPPMSNDPRQSGIETIRRYAQLHEKPSVIVFHSDEMAVAALGEAFRQGIRVPQELSIVGSDNLRAYRDITPSLATYDGQFDLMARLLAEVTLNRLRHPELPPQRRNIIRHFVPGDSLCKVNRQSNMKSRRGKK